MIYVSFNEAVFLLCFVILNKAIVVSLLHRLVIIVVVCHNPFPIRPDFIAKDVATASNAVVPTAVHSVFSRE